MVDSFQPMDCSLPDSSVHGISQARILEWVAISFFRGSSWPRDGTRIFCIGRQILYHRATWEAQTFLRVLFPLLLMNILECGCFCIISDFPTKGQRTHSWHHGVLHSAEAVPGMVIHSLNKHSLSIWWVSTVTVCSVMSDSVTPWTVVCQDSLSLGFSRQEYWSGLPFPAPEYLPDPGIEPASLASSASEADFLPLFHWWVSGTVLKAKNTRWIKSVPHWVYKIVRETEEKWNYSLWNSKCALGRGSI